MTSPTTRATRRCAARCCGRIEIVPSRRLALAWLTWLGIGLAVVLGGVSLPSIARFALGLILVAFNLPALRTGVLLHGSRAVRALEWDDERSFSLRSGLRSGSGVRALPARLLPASFRLGMAFLVLWFSTPAGLRVVLIDGGTQDPVAFRRLCRHLARGELLPSRPKV